MGRIKGLKPFAKTFFALIASLPPTFQIFPIRTAKRGDFIAVLLKRQNFSLRLSAEVKEATDSFGAFFYFPLSFFKGSYRYASFSCCKDKRENLFSYLSARTIIEKTFFSLTIQYLRSYLYLKKPECKKGGGSFRFRKNPPPSFRFAFRKIP